MNLFIRADANSKIGTGHVMRCIALAQAWCDEGGVATFITHCENKLLSEKIQKEGFKIISIDHVCPDSADLAKTIAILKNENTDQKKWLVLDGYHFTSEYQKAIREAGYCLLVIDDMNHLPHYYANILLNQNIHAPELNYSCNADTKLLLGTSYTLIRKEFLRYRDLKRNIPERAKNIFVFLGGADSNNVTLKIIEALKIIDLNDITVKIIVGPANPYQEMLHKILETANFKSELLKNPVNLPELMAWADLAISAGGSTCWEFALLGLPNIVIVVAKNQIQIAESLSDKGIVCNMGWYEMISSNSIAACIENTINDITLRKTMSKKSENFIDGEGSRRVVQKIKRLTV